MNLLLLICSLMGMWIRLGSRMLLIGVISVLVTLRLLARRLNMFGYGLFVTLVKWLQGGLGYTYRSFRWGAGYEWVGCDVGTCEDCCG